MNNSQMLRSIVTPVDIHSSSLRLPVTTPRWQYHNFPVMLNAKLSETLGPEAFRATAVSGRVLIHNQWAYVVRL